MPERQTVERARRLKRRGKAATTQAGEFVREEMHHVERGKHGAKNRKQAIAIGLSKARRAGVKLAAPRRGKTRARTRAKAQCDLRQGRTSRRRKPSRRRSRAVSRALKREGRKAASRRALGRQARRTARARGRSARRRASQKAVRTKGRAGLRLAARKAARTRQASRKAA